MRRVSLSLSMIAAGVSMLFAAGDAQALGFGRSTNVSHLGQPLNFAATVRLESDESLPRECVTAEVLSGDFRVAPAAVRVSVEPAPNPNERLVRVTTNTGIDEPVVTVTVVAGCQQRLSRSFVALVDPPGINLAGSAPAEPASLPPQRSEPETAPVVAVTQGADAASAPRRAAPVPPREPRARAEGRPAPVPRPRAVAQAPAKPRERSAATAAPFGAAPRTPGPRLQLEPGAVAAQAAASAASAAAAQAAAAAASEVAASSMAAASATAAASAAQQRIATLEEQLKLLREESQKTQKALATLQSTLSQAQDQRYSNPLVYALAALSALLALGLALLWWRQSQSRQNSQWWLAPTGGAVAMANTARPAPARPAVDAAAARQETQPAVMDERHLVHTQSGETLPAATAAAALSPLTEPPPVTLIPPGAAEPSGVPRRELSVEELIDLEQQADFFVVLGQEDAAIDLLMGHVRSSGGASPLPYLKLLEIYRRRGDHDAYERVRERFNRRFSAYAPDWESDLVQGRPLDDYPQMLRQLQRLWDEPLRVTQMLDAALMRQDGEGETYDLPAYRELLFLYSIARDLGEHPTNARAVDLELPMDGGVAEKPIEELTASRLMGFAPTNQLTVQVDLDVTRPMPDHPGSSSGNSDFLGLVDPGGKRDGDRY